MTKSLMIQGTNSNAGKSLLVAGLCRYFSNSGLNVRPFKPQNMSNNAAVAVDGGEIGRAQALQARACRVPPSVHMNPVLLKPETDQGAQVIVQGKVWGTLNARDYGSQKGDLLDRVLDSYAQLSADADLVIIEGAGSPAEVNLRENDIANMGFALAADVPVVLAGDIDRGGVIASLVGTHAVLGQSDNDKIKGFIINKFRGNTDLFKEADELITRRTGWPSLGIVPWFADAARLPAEDALDLRGKTSPGAAIKIAVPQLARIANFDDLDPLVLSHDVSVDLVEPGRALPGDADLIILPGSKSTMGDLAFLREQGWDVDIAAHVRRGGRVLGLCGGYQMMGRSIADPQGVEGQPGRVDGLGLLNVTTALTGDKAVKEVLGIHLKTGHEVSGYEIHLGRTNGPDRSRPWLEIDGTPEGAMSEDELCAGAYVHGIFTSDGFREAYLDALRPRVSGGLEYEPMIDKTLDALADHLAAHLDMDRLLAIAKG